MNIDRIGTTIVTTLFILVSSSTVVFAKSGKITGQSFNKSVISYIKIASITETAVACGLLSPMSRDEAISIEQTRVIRSAHFLWPMPAHPDILERNTGLSDGYRKHIWPLDDDLDAAKKAAEHPTKLQCSSPTLEREIATIHHILSANGV